MFPNTEIVPKLRVFVSDLTHESRREFWSVFTDWNRASFLLFLFVKMLKRERTTRRVFVVFEVYYKHGEYNVEYCHGVGALKKYLHEKLSHYCKYSGKNYDEMAKELEREDENGDESEEKSLRKLMATAIKYGEEEIFSQRGYGIVAVEEIVSELA